MKKKIFTVFFVYVLILVGCGKTNYKELETNFTSLASRYYKEQLEGKVMGFDNHIISLDAMEKAGYDISNFVDKNCDKTSYSLIKLQLNENREIVGDFKVENHLICDGYSS